MRVDARISMGIAAVIILLLLAFIGYKYIYRGYLRNDNGPVLKKPKVKDGIKILFLHHSTGRNIWNGGVREWFEDYNSREGTNFSITEQEFPKSSPYGWKNYPYDYWNIWVNHAGNEPYKDEPTLEMITKEYDIVIWKHCFPVSGILPDTGDPDISSDEKRQENYRLQYEALKEKMHEFPDTKFIVWTGAALVEGATDPESARRARDFFEWVKNDWDEKGDNIFIWDFYALETEGGLFMKDEYAVGPTNSHPDEDFSRGVAPFLCQRIVDVENGDGDTGRIDGKH